MKEEPRSPSSSPVTPLGNNLVTGSDEEFKKVPLGINALRDDNSDDVGLSSPNHPLMSKSSDYVAVRHQSLMPPATS